MTRRVPVTQPSHTASSQVPAHAFAAGRFWHGLSTTDDASPAKKVFYTIITSNLLIPGDDAPVTHGAVVVQDASIVWVGVKDDIPATYTAHAHKSHHVPYMMPGLWDAHVHFGDFPNDPE